MLDGAEVRAPGCAGCSNLCGTDRSRGANRIHLASARGRNRLAQLLPRSTPAILIGTALANNRDLRVAALRIEEARALYNIQSADLYPNLNVTATGDRGRTPASISPTGTTVVSSNYQVGLGLAAFELDFFGRVRSLNDAALAQYLATEEAQRAAHISLVSEVATAYLTERGYAEQYELAKYLRNAQPTLSSWQSSDSTSAHCPHWICNRTKRSLQTARVAQLALARQRAQAWNALTVLVGQPLTDLPPAEDLSKLDLATDLPAGLPSDSADAASRHP
jgi:multidrug efflux system outer membrane protein